MERIYQLCWLAANGDLSTIIRNNYSTEEINTCVHDFSFAVWGEGPFFLGTYNASMIAAWYRHLDVVEYFVGKKGANLEVKGGRFSDFTVLDCAKHKSWFGPAVRPDLVRYLEWSAHNYLIELNLMEKQKRSINPTNYDSERAEITNPFTSHYVRCDKETLVNFYIALAMIQLQKCPNTSPSNPIHIKGTENLYDHMEWLLTAFWILGYRLPDNQFDQKSLRFGPPNSSKMDSRVCSVFHFNSQAILASWRGDYSSIGDASVFRKHLNRTQVQFFLNKIPTELAAKRENERRIDLNKREEKRLSEEKRRQDVIDAEVLKLKRTNQSLLAEAGKFDAKAREIKELLDKGADINYQEERNGFSALMIAVDTQSDRIAEYLLSQSANPLLKNKAGEKASDLASSDSPIYQRLKGFELLAATLSGNLEAVKLAINTNAYINFKGVGGYTALLVAVENNLVEIVSFLLLQDADLTITRNDGKGPFELVKDEIIAELLNDARSLTENQTPMFSSF